MSTLVKARFFSRTVASVLSLEGQEVEIDGQKLTPDEHKAYIEFSVGYGFGKARRGVNAYNSATHPQVVSNSFKSMKHSVFNWEHKIKKYGRSDRDYSLGTVVGVEHPAAPETGWQISNDAPEPPHIRAVAVIHKCLEKAPTFIGEHSGGRWKYSVSQECNHYLEEGGFVIYPKSEASLFDETMTAGTRDAVEAFTPEDFRKQGLGYIPWMEASPDLKECYDKKKLSVNKAFQGRPVVLLKGGLNGTVEYWGVGVVRIPAEKEAEVALLLASDPSAWEELMETGTLELFRNSIAATQALISSMR